MAERKIKVSSLKVNPDNPRLIRDEKFMKLVNSVKNHPGIMALRPIVIESWDNPVILGGNMRYRAIKELKYKEIPEVWVKTADQLTDEERKAFIVLDNSQFGEWDMDILANEWDNEKLAEWGVDLPKLKETDYEPVLDPETSDRIVTAEDIKRAQEQLDKVAERKQEELSEVMCPKCGHEFKVN